MSLHTLRFSVTCTACIACFSCGGGGSVPQSPDPAEASAEPPPPVATSHPTLAPTQTPTLAPTQTPTLAPTRAPTPAPKPTVTPTRTPSPSPPVVKDAPCNGYRWEEKIAADDASAPLDAAASSPTSTTIDRLLALAPPAPRLDERTSPVETTVYRVSGVTVSSMVHAVDGDYHLVLADSKKHTVIAESPDPACVHASVLLDRIQNVRPIAAGAHIGDIVTVEGAGFFDYQPNGAVGEAPNGIELHPITAICIGTGCTPK